MIEALKHLIQVLHIGKFFIIFFFHISSQILIFQGVIKTENSFFKRKHPELSSNRYKPGFRRLLKHVLLQMIYNHYLIFNHPIYEEDSLSKSFISKFCDFK